MTVPSAQHSSFVIERSFAAPVTRVFAAWSDAAKKRRWFSCHDGWNSVEYALDFREGGSELSVVAASDGVRHVMNARYFEIVPNERIVYAYEMHVGSARISASLVTVELARDGARTRMTFTEQVVFLDGRGDVRERREGTEAGLQLLDLELGRS